MSTIRGDATKKPQNYVRELRVGGHDVVEDQWRAETDAVTTVLLNNQVALNPGLVVAEQVTLAATLNLQITVSKPVGALLGVLAFDGSGIPDPGTVTAWTPDADQVANPGVIDATGTPVVGEAVVYYTAA